MRLLLASLKSNPPELDRDTADRLLAGRLDPGDAPPGYAPVARLLAAATTEPSPDELAGERAVVAEFAAMTRSHPPTSVPRRAGAPSKRFSVKAAAMAVAAVLMLGGAAVAATGHLPGSAKPIAQDAPTSSRGGPAADGQRGAAKGPDASGAARDGLCRAWLAGKGDQNGERTDSPAFTALAKAAGGADKVAAYCKTSTGERDAAAKGPDASGAARDGLCRAWLAGKGDQNGERTDSPAFTALAKAAGGADKVAAYCKTSTSGGQGQGGGPPTTG